LSAEENWLNDPRDILTFESQRRKLALLKRGLGFFP
jgi:hypothetical protein